MKKVIALGLICLLTCTAKGQLFDRIKNKVNQKVNDAVDKTIDKTIDKTVDNVGKKKEKTPSNVPVGNDNTGNADNTGVASTPSVAAGPNLDVKSYSRFDFVPGAKVIVQDDFSQDAIGDFPAQWNTRTSGEVVTVNNHPGKWLSVRQDGVFYPEYISNLPDNFTLQVDVMATNGVASISSFSIGLVQAKTDDEKFAAGEYSSLSIPGFKISLSPANGSSSGVGTLSYSSNHVSSTSVDAAEFRVPKKNMVTVSIWRQKQRIRVYLDSTKALDLPRALDATALLNSVFFSAYAPDFSKEGGAYFVGNIRLAVGAPDTRNKLITEGKFITHGILFDVNSDKVQAASYGSLQDIANVLKENASVRVKIIGHTDADGEDQPNLDLSKRRAEAVKASLTQVFGIDAARMETDGKGETQPIDNSNTTAAKANNRRVEFVKL
ncbi:OmpA family protein [Chitinophaga sp. 22321]|uniref:OmpA family protein n=1 Tax=Chitinophaga hostae TaxID=2831022 RepID=A0ABS5J708_9BACT|nr:OmpA family protein [Chitinophaga hostae]MBS0030222.1 OmpA family protein [Chitinophaga hostae]